MKLRKQTTAEAEARPSGRLQQAEQRLAEAQAALEQTKRALADAEKRAQSLAAAMAGTSDLNELAKLQSELSAARQLIERLRAQVAKAENLARLADTGLRNIRANINVALGKVRHWQNELAKLDEREAELRRQVEQLEGPRRQARIKMARVLDELQELGGDPDMAPFGLAEIVAPPRR